jgi:hypothetical protein
MSVVSPGLGGTGFLGLGIKVSVQTRSAKPIGTSAKPLERLYKAKKLFRDVGGNHGSRAAHNRVDTGCVIDDELGVCTCWGFNFAK